MKPSPAFQFYPQDFLVGTADMTAEEVGGYIRLLCYQWAKGSLPNDDKKLSQLSGISDGLSLGNVSVKFRLCEDGLKRNDRLELIRLEQEEYRKKQSNNGSKGGNPNFQNGKHNPYYKPKDNPPHNPKINSSPSSSSSPSSINTEEGFEKKKTSSNGKREFSELFNAFWEIYPKSKDKDGCRQAWMDLGLSKEEQGKILSCLKEKILNPDWIKDGGKFIPNPINWIQKKGWEDKINIPASGVKNRYLPEGEGLNGN